MLGNSNIVQRELLGRPNVRSMDSRNRAFLIENAVRIVTENMLVVGFV